MSFRPAGHRHAFLRMLAIAFLMVSMSANAVLVAVTEMHEAQHHTETGHAHDAPADSTNHEPSMPYALADPADDSAFLHAVIQSGHCCSYSAALLPAVVALTPASAAPLPPVTRSSLRPDAGRPRLLRPPING